jgi:hypothetical protein
LPNVKTKLTRREPLGERFCFAYLPTARRTSSELMICAPSARVGQPKDVEDITQFGAVAQERARTTDWTGVGLNECDALASETPEWHGRCGV